MTSALKIITHHVFPPIPTRSHDWCAWYDGTEENGKYGWGATEAEAINDLRTNVEFCGKCGQSAFGSHCSVGGCPVGGDL